MPLSTCTSATAAFAAGMAVPASRTERTAGTRAIPTATPAASVSTSTSSDGLNDNVGSTPTASLTAVIAIAETFASTPRSLIVWVRVATTSVPL